MRFAALRRTRAVDQPPGTVGVVRLDRRTKNLTRRLRPGDIAVIDHVDLDRVAAEALVSCQVGGVVNVAPSVSGRYPNLGPDILLANGVP
ncbi:MAG: thiamine pyrophosphokinase, partial [Frankiaceae bacterium]|nr:thiamine pyrophosphokinase [Frankiaceae bacterium]